jgi:single-stranded-DNA-specific exonuclease
MTGIFACGVERSLLGQPWQWRRAGGDELNRDLTDQLLLARGEESDPARYRTPTIRDFLPDPLHSAIWIRRRGLADAVEG